MFGTNNSLGTVLSAEENYQNQVPKIFMANDLSLAPPANPEDYDTKHTSL
ncbi:MAG: hypothetical protein ACFCAD_02615 [Pleurocapsa sp.]